MPPSVTQHTGDKVVRDRPHVPPLAVRLGRREPWSGVDCSGLVVAVYRRLGVKLPHQSDELWHSLYRVRTLRKGDIVAFGSSGYSGHVGLYIGHGRFIHAVGAGKGVQIGWLHGAPRPPRLSRRGAAEGAATPSAPDGRRRLASARRPRRW